MINCENIIVTDISHNLELLRTAIWTSIKTHLLTQQGFPGTLLTGTGVEVFGMWNSGLRLLGFPEWRLSFRDGQLPLKGFSDDQYFTGSL